MKDYTKLMSTVVHVKPTSVLTFKSDEFSPYTSEYTVVKPDAQMKFIES